MLICGIILHEFLLFLLFLFLHTIFLSLSRYYNITKATVSSSFYLRQIRTFWNIEKESWSSSCVVSSVCTLWVCSAVSCQLFYCWRSLTISDREQERKKKNAVTPCTIFKTCLTKTEWQTEDAWLTLAKFHDNFSFRRCRNHLKFFTLTQWISSKRTRTQKKAINVCTQENCMLGAIFVESAGHTCFEKNPLYSEPWSSNKCVSPLP